MPIRHFYVPSIIHGSEIERKVKDVFKLKEIVNVVAEYCFNVEVVGELSINDLEILEWLLTDPMERAVADPIDRAGHLKDSTQLDCDQVYQILIEIGPRYANLCL